jgi:8-oxo-dGTP diphosphatase
MRDKPTIAVVTTAVVVVILTVVEDDVRVLLIRRSADPFRDSWALPGGLLDPSESLDRAAVRKLLDETGVQDVFLEQLYTFGELITADGAQVVESPRRPPPPARARKSKAPAPNSQRPATRTIAVTYFALVQHGQVRLRDSDLWHPQWHNAYTLPPLAFDNNTVVDYAIRRLRAKLDYTNVAYSLVPRHFTLSDLQQVYEAILDRPMDKRNFRRRMLSLGIIKPAGGTRKEGAHRPAQLYTFTKREPVVV